MIRFIYDDNKEKYRLSWYVFDDGSFQVTVKHNSDYAGEAVVNVDEKGNLIVEDIRIRDDNDKCSKSTVLEEILSTANKLSFRGLGLGREVLKWIIDYSRQNNYKHIFGSIVQTDLTKSPFLVNFYKKYGFKDCAPYEHHIPGAKLYLVLDL
jgi:GNAT superfamily N-acetyltransferase